MVYYSVIVCIIFGIISILFNSVLMAIVFLGIILFIPLFVFGTIAIQNILKIVYQINQLNNSIIEIKHKINTKK